MWRQFPTHIFYILSYCFPPIRHCSFNCQVLFTFADGIDLDFEHLAEYTQKFSDEYEVGFCFFFLVCVELLLLLLLLLLFSFWYGVSNYFNHDLLRRLRLDLFFSVWLSMTFFYMTFRGFWGRLLLCLARLCRDQVKQRSDQGRVLIETVPFAHSMIPVTTVHLSDPSRQDCIRRACNGGQMQTLCLG